MKFSLSTVPSRWWFALLLLCVSGPAGCAAESSAKPVLLYSRHFNAPGETRYLPDGTYRQVLTNLRRDFEVRVHDQPLTRESLAGVKVVLIANPSDQAVGTNPPPHHFSAADIEGLSAFVENGGGLIIMGNQENHNLEIEDTNKLLARFGFQFKNLYTDAKQLVLPKDTPIIGGLRWAYYTGNLVAIDAAHPARPHPLVINDLSVKPLGGSRDQRGALLAVSNPGRGRVVAVTDAGWITDTALDGRGLGPVAIKEQDNWEIFRRLAHWAAHSNQAANPKAGK